MSTISILVLKPRSHGSYLIANQRMLKSFGRLWALFTPKERAHTLVLLCLMLLGAIFEMAGVGVIPVFIGILADPEQLLKLPRVAVWLSSLGIDLQEEIVLWGGVGLLVFFVAKNIYLAGLMYLQGRFVYNRFVSLSSKLFASYLAAPYTFHLQRNSSELLRNTSQEVTALVQNVAVPSLLILMEGLVVISVTALLVLIEPWISLLSFLLLGGASYLFWKLVRRRTGELGHVQQRERRWMIQIVNEALGGIKDAKILNREAHFAGAYFRSVKEFARTAHFVKLIGQLPRPFIETISVGGLLLVAVVFAAQGRPMESIVPTLVLFGAAIVRLMPSVQRIMTAISLIRFSFPSLQVVCRELESAQNWAAAPSRAMQKAESSAEGLAFRHSIHLDAVTFQYPGQQEAALDRVSLSIRKNQMIGLVGASGAGKSTLVDLILGLLEPQSGRVLVDGVDIAGALERTAWQKLIGYIPQSIFLADTSIRRNIAFGINEEEIDEARVWEALEAAQLADFICSLPDGVNTDIGERGVRLSGGQRQRIGIARALYHRPTVLVMDEATSALDNQTERDFVEAVERFRRSTTVIIVAHRLSTVRNCDCLFMFEGGKLVDSGNYDSLRSTNAKFRATAAVAQ